MTSILVCVSNIKCLVNLTISKVVAPALQSVLKKIQLHGNPAVAKSL